MAGKLHNLDSEITFHPRSVRLDRAVRPSGL